MIAIGSDHGGYKLKEQIKKCLSLGLQEKDARKFMRFFLSGATNLEFDKQGRITIPSPLLSHANIKKECVIIGVGERAEIWGVEEWEKFFDDSKEDISDIAENLFDESVVM